MNKMISLLILVIILSGCSTPLKSQDEVSLTRYESLYNNILDATEIQSSSAYFAIEGVVSELDDGQYRYDLYIDDPKVAMRDILVVVVEDNIPFNQQKEMMPSIGLFDASVKMYPNQVDTDLGYYKGINLNRIIEQSSIRVRVLVQFNDASRERNISEVIELILSIKK